MARERQQEHERKTFLSRKQISAHRISNALLDYVCSNLWRRNGEENMFAQIFNYTSLPFCVQFQDADIFMLQVAVLLLGCDHFLSVYLDRFELFQYFFPTETSTAYSNNIQMEMDTQQLTQLVEEFF